MFRELTLSSCIVASAVVLPAQAQAPPISSQPTIFSVCEGEFERNCPDHDAFTYCGTINGWAEQACKIQNSREPPKYRLIKLQDRSGNKCGYAQWKVICVN
ncbi:hypothetical protein HZZ13_00620 [Bradyrhizobium sp. CNPSo 4010]|uniref:Uncharacterized protein n=1 Tax=Bradyrhizobium agreste TaxID=2751811 RepID=A0ABS0PGK1_9BRAD|nr:hypothetical protein [Bradyrhizobium agreste]MBH5396324.1 hypothetical protein [Bradyrhizobium agreste]